MPNSLPRQGADRLAPAIYGLFFFFLFLAFSTALESKFVLPKAIVLAAGVLSVGALLAFRIWRSPGIAPPPWALRLALALGAWWIVSMPFALHLPTALDGEYNRYNGLWTHLCWLALFVASLSLPLGAIATRRIIALLTAAVGAVAAVNVAEVTGLSSFGLKEVSTLGDRVAAGALMNFAIPFAALALLRIRHRGLKAGLGGLLALLVVSEFLSQGRGPWMGLAVAALILAAGLVRSKAAWKLLALALLVTTLLAGFAVKMSPAVAQRFATLTQLRQDESLRHRFVIYQAAARAIGEHPLAGIGFDNFRNAYPAYRVAEDRHFFSNIVPTMAHDGYLQMAATNGMPALLLYLALVGGVLTKLGREIVSEAGGDRRDLMLGLLAAIGAYLVQDLVGWLDMAVTSVFWVLLGLALNLASNGAAQPAALRSQPGIAVFAGMMLLLSLYLLNDRYARAVADAQLYAAQALDVGAQWPAAEALIERALARLPGDSRTEMVAGQIFAVRFAYARDAKAYARGRALLEASFEHNRYDRLRLFNIVALESLALETGQMKTTSEFARKAIPALYTTDADNPGYLALKARFLAAQDRFGDAPAASLK